MADTPQNTILPTWVLTWEHFIKAHERLILIVAASLVLWHFGDKVTQWFDNKHTAEQAQINQQITQQENQNQLLQKQLVQMQASFDETVRSLNAKIDAKKQAVIIQQKVDAALPPQELSTRWETLLKLQPGNITPQTNGTITVSTDVAHATVNELDNLPLLREQVQDTQIELNQCVDLSAKKDTSIAGLKTEVQQEKDGRAADAKVAKDNERKSFWKGTKIGAALTVVGITALKILVIVK